MFVAMMLAAAMPQEERAPPPSKAARAADAFSLDLPTAEAEGDAAGATPPTARAAAPDASVALSLDTPIRELLADPRGRAVLDADMEGLSTDANFAEFDRLSLRQFQAHTGGQLTDALLEKVAADLANPEPVLAARKRRSASGR